MKRLGFTNKMVLANFVELANAMGWNVYIPFYKYLKKDPYFPVVKNPVESINDVQQFFKVEKNNGRWQIQKHDRGVVHGVTDWTTTRMFLNSLDLMQNIGKEKREQGRTLLP